MANTIIHKAATRGFEDYGWLKTYHTFSFADYYDPARMNFGALRVLNDDFVEAGMGFGTHPHSNMEIVSIPLEGDLEHKDSMGYTSVIKRGDVQVMTAGTGIRHSEYNYNSDRPVKFLQIWIIPGKRGLKPRYDQITLNDTDRKNKLRQIVSPDTDDEGAWINQQAWFHMGEFDKGESFEYGLRKNGNGLYIFVLKGEVTVEGSSLSTRDGMGIRDTDTVSFIVHDDLEILLMEVPMEIYGY
jgi:quercetin 2,3-dioxygenase